MAKYNQVKFNDESFEYKDLLNLTAEKGKHAVLTDDSLLELDDKPEETNNNNAAPEEKEDEEMRALRLFLRDVKLGCKSMRSTIWLLKVNFVAVHKPTVAEPEQTNQFGYVFVNEANERVRHKDQAMVDLTQFAQGIISYRVEYLANGNFEWLTDNIAVEDVLLVPPRPKKEEKDEAKEKAEKELREKEAKEREEKVRAEKELEEQKAKEKAEELKKKTPEEREKDRVAAILAELQRDENYDTEATPLQANSEPYKPVAVIDVDTLIEKPLKAATMARYVTISKGLILSFNAFTLINSIIRGVATC